jgi:ribosomal protein L30/L7E
MPASRRCGAARISETVVADDQPQVRKMVSV